MRTWRRICVGATLVVARCVVMLTLEEVKKIARLANLNLSEEEIDLYAPQLSEVLEYVKVLNEPDTPDVLPTYQVTGLENVFRGDIVAPSLSQFEALRNASQTERGYFVTGRVNAGI